MAIIKCPECGHDVSDKAPVCLYCGVEIAGKYIARPVASPRPVTRPVTPTQTTSQATTQPTSQPTAQPVQPRPVQPTVTSQPQARPVQPTTTSQPQARPVQPTVTSQPTSQQTSQQAQARPTQNIYSSQARPTQTTYTSQARTTQQTTGRPQQTGQRPQPSIYDHGGGSGVMRAPGGFRPDNQKPKKGHALIYFILILILIVGGVALFKTLGSSGHTPDDEAKAYRFAMQSTEPSQLKAYLDEYSSASREHRDSVQARLSDFSKLQREWDNVVTSNSRSAFEEYAKKNPDSPYCTAALHKVDSIDWARATNDGSTEAYDSYLAEHPDGEHTADARSKSTNPGVDAAAQTEVATPGTTQAPAQPLTVSPDEKTRVDNTTTYFFQAINSHDPAKINSKVPQTMTRFLNTQNATSADVLAFANHLMDGGVTNYNWHIDHNSYSVTKTDAGNGTFEYSTTFKASLSKNTASGNQQQTYNVSAKVKDGRVTSLTMTKAGATAQ